MQTMPIRRFPVRKRIRLPLPVYKQEHAFFITIATHDKYPWFQSYPQLCNTAVQEIRDLSIPLRIAIYAWCIMPDHLHILLQGSDIIEFVRQFKGRMTPKARALKSGKRLWQRSFFDHALRKEESLSDVACYIWENPVRADLVKDPRVYQWSGSEVWPDWRDFYGRG